MAFVLVVFPHSSMAKSVAKLNPSTAKIVVEMSRKMLLGYSDIDLMVFELIELR